MKISLLTKKNYDNIHISETEKLRQKRNNKHSTKLTKKIFTCLDSLDTFSLKTAALSVLTGNNANGEQIIKYVTSLYTK